MENLMCIKYCDKHYENGATYCVSAGCPNFNTRVVGNPKNRDTLHLPTVEQLEAKIERLERKIKEELSK